MKKLLTIFLAFLLIFPASVFAENSDKKTFLDELAKESDLSFEEVYLLQLNGYKLTNELLEKYRKQARTESFPTAVYLANLINVLDYEGYDIYNFEGLNLVEELYNYKFLSREASQGIATVVRVLNRFDNIPSDAVNNPLVLAYSLLGYQNKDGGFGSFVPEVSHIDTTATILTALAPYTYIEEFNQAVKKAVKFLSDIQNQDGTFTSFGKETCVTISLVIMALSELKTDPYIPDFKKNDKTLPDILNEYMLEDNTYKNLKDGKYNKEATVYAYTALYSIENLYSGKISIYNPTDFRYEITSDAFNDYNEISDNCKAYVEIAKNTGITKGDTDGNFYPKNNITRAETVTALLRMMNFELTSAYEPVFLDVTKENWHWKYVLTAKQNGLVNGTSANTFEPESNITKQDVAVILTNIYPMPYDLNNIFTDYENTSDYAKNAVLMCVQNGIFDLENNQFNPQDQANRETVISALIKLMIYLATE